jgi:hypothetical protein
MQKIRKMNLYQQVADNLNKKGILPFSAREWTSGNVQRILRHRLNEPAVFEEYANVTKQALNQ